MLPRILRLKRPQDFQTVRKRGSRWRDSLFTLYALRNGLPHNRFGIVVSKRVGKAVIRNTVKRRLRSAIWQWLPRLVSGYDVVMVVNPPAAEASYQVLEAALGVGLAHLRLTAAHDEEALV
jgi:ribonuclease P protein component